MKLATKNRTQQPGRTRKLKKKIGKGKNLMSDAKNENANMEDTNCKIA